MFLNLKRRIFKFVFVLGVIVLTLTFYDCESGESATNIRKMAVAGTFYSANSQKLRQNIESFLKNVPVQKFSGRPIAGIVPHAGYIFSGQIAAYTYKQLENLDIETVIIIGPSHHYLLHGISIYPKGFYKTPLGLTEVDAKLAKALLSESKLFSYQPKAHLLEHCIEVQIPFLQVINKRFKIVPILIGNKQGLEKILAKAIMKHSKGKKVFVLASSDMTHYPTYEISKKIDNKSLKLVQSLQPEKLLNYDKNIMSEKIPNLYCIFCGLSAVVTVIDYAKLMGAEKAHVLKAANSGDLKVGDKRRVVGYSAVIFNSNKSVVVKSSERNIKNSNKTKPLKNKNNNFKNQEKKEDNMSKSNFLTPEMGKELLKIARQTLIACTDNDVIPSPKYHFDVFKEKRGAFVTLQKHGNLRGCIGYILPIENLEKTVIDNTVNAALKDPRFNRVSPSEVADITIEISILTKPKQIASLSDFVLGKHGIILKKGWHQAVFLPQVAPEQGWDKATTMSYLSQKAGMSKDAWQEGATFEVFEAQIFHEPK